MGKLIFCLIIAFGNLLSFIALSFFPGLIFGMWILALCIKDFHQLRMTKKQVPNA